MKSTALLVIDIQRGAFDGQRCSPIAEPDTLVDHAVSLIGAARDAGASVVFIQHCDGPDEVFEEGSAHWAMKRKPILSLNPDASPAPLARRPDARNFVR